MNPRTFIPAFLVIAGLGLAASGLSGLCSGPALRHSQNLFAIQGSAYGKLLARLSETTIDRVWHLGVEQVVPHYMSGSAHGSETEAASAPDSEPAPDKPTKPLIEQGKQWFQDRIVAQHHRTNPNSLNQSHLATVHHDIERMLLRSFKLDPTHYGSYDSYHLFLTTSTLGGDPRALEQTRRIANAAIGSAFREDEDPEPWLTAASAGMNLFLMDASSYMEAGTPIPLEILKKHRQQIGYCLNRFEELQEKAEVAGTWQNLSTDRQMEIAERNHFSKRTFKQFDVMIARAEGKPAPGAPDTEVAEKAKEEGP